MSRRRHANASRPLPAKRHSYYVLASSGSHVHVRNPTAGVEPFVLHCGQTVSSTECRTCDGACSFSSIRQTMMFIMMYVPNVTITGVDLVISSSYSLLMSSTIIGRLPGA
jgi:hypothetical protein